MEVKKKIKKFLNYYRNFYNEIQSKFHKSISVLPVWSNSTYFYLLSFLICIILVLTMNWDQPGSSYIGSVLDYCAVLAFIYPLCAVIYLHYQTFIIGNSLLSSRKMIIHFFFGLLVLFVLILASYQYYYKIASPESLEKNWQVLSLLFLETFLYFYYIIMLIIKYITDFFKKKRNKT